MSISLAAPAEVEAVIRFTDPSSAGAVLHSDGHESSTSPPDAALRISYEIRTISFLG